MKARIKAFFTDMPPTRAYTCMAVWVVAMTWVLCLIPMSIGYIFPTMVTWMVCMFGGTMWLFSRIKRERRDRGYF